MATGPLDHHRIQHPSPHRDRVKPWRLAASLAAPPLAWAVQLIASFSLAAHACFPNREPIAAPAWPGLIGVLWAISAASLVIGLGSAALSWQHWLHTRDEKSGSGHTLLEVGEGRTRFLALCGVIVGTSFAAALLWTASGLLLVPVCGA